MGHEQARAARQPPDAAKGRGTEAADGAVSTTPVVPVLGACHEISVSGSWAERIGMVADLQRGHATRKQLVAAGIGSDRIDRLIARGMLRRIHRGVYAVGHAAPTDLGPETAALLACGEHAVLSHHTAAALWAMVPEGDGLLHVTIRGRNGARPHGIRVHRTKRLTRGEVRIVEDLPVTSPARTLIDVAPDLDKRSLERAVEEALIQKLVTEGELRTAANSFNSRSGAARTLAVLDSWREPGITRSEAERRFRALMRAAELPEPLTNVRVHGYLVDCYWPSLGVVVEIQGYKFHSGRAAFERDTRKGAKLTAAGLTVCYVTWRQMEQEPYAVVARVAQVLALAEARAA
jgi:very-short-patch-repair endonuclease